LQNINEKKIFIFLEFTRYRSSCQKVVEFLRHSGSNDNLSAALYLEQRNTSLGPSQTVLKSVVLARHPMIGSAIYEMARNPRGKCIIINNHVKFHGNTKLVDLKSSQRLRESDEFKKIFEELHFDVEPYYNLNTNEIKQRLRSLPINYLNESDALIIMIMSHGQDEMILGIDACEGNNQNDLMPISDVVNIFSDNNCTPLKRKPKLFFFICCRISRK
jgi:hypothetical protein